MQPDTYGTTAVSFYNVDAFDLGPFGGGVKIGDGLFRYSTDCSGTCFVASLNLPSGATLISLELDYNDTSTVGQAGATLEVCDFAATFCEDFPSSGCSNGLTACSGGPDADGKYYRVFDLTRNGIQINNYYYRYLLYGYSNTLDGSTGISRIQIGYKLQVSPGPVSATFTDVPTSHPFFKFVQALVAAGITAGYPDGRFGVDDYITRGQMAVFLSTALGLNWP